MNAAESLAVSEDARRAVRILVVDDERTLRESCISVLAMQGYAVSGSGDGAEARSLVKSHPFDILLVDLHMTPVSGTELLEEAVQHQPQALVIVMTGDPSVESSLEVRQRGAWDYLPKPFTASHLQILIGRAAHTVLIARESSALAEVRDARHGQIAGPALLGASPAFMQVMALARRVSVTDASVFLSGESGVGKEQIAQFIHHNSRRSSRPLVAVNCAALPEALLESEMFGHVQGAFTGALRDKPGLLEVANGGTLFLDEVTEMPPALQAKFLRVIQDGMVRRVGSTGTDCVVNVRFIAASNTDPATAMAQGRLRHDLYYRLCVVSVNIPSLRERRVDIPVLSHYFLERFWKQHRSADGDPPGFTDDAVEALTLRQWPGNVRELQNVIEHAVVLLDPGRAVGPDDLPHMAGDSGDRSLAVTPVDFGDGSYHGARERMLANFEKVYLTGLIARTHGNMSKAARIAGVDRTTLYRLMEKHGLQRGTVIVSR